jgi:Ca2+:H+ antiporter
MRAFLRVTNLLLIAIPFGVVSETMGWGKGASFLLLCASIIPLAGLSETFADALIIRSKMQLGNILNAVFTNLSFIILGLVLLYEGLGTVAQASVAGAIISNTLFVLGAALIMGHFRARKQEFEREHARGYAKFLVFILFALVLPTLLQTSGSALPGNATVDHGPVIEFSVWAAFALLLIYGAYLLHDVFHVFDTEYKLQQSQQEPFAEETATKRIVRLGTLIRKEDTHAGRIPRPVAVIGLSVTALATIYVSSLLVPVTRDLTTGAAPFAIGPYTLVTIHLSQTFVGLVVIPIIGSLAYNMNAIRAAMHGKADETVASTAGTAIQIALIAVPVFILFSYFVLANNTFDLLFTKLEIVIIGLGAVIYYLVVEDGKGTWLEGCILMLCYLIFAVAVYFI